MFTRIDIQNLNINKVKCLAFNKTIIPLTLVGYELIIADSLCSYPMHVRGIINLLFSLQSAEKGYRRLTPDQSVGLRHAGYVIRVEEVKKVSCENVF